MFNILMPMAGDGTRTRSLGELPKPMIKIFDKPIFEYAASVFNKNNHFTFIARQDHDEKYKIFDYIKEFYPNSTIIKQKEKLDGAALSCLLSKSFLYNDTPLITCDSDIFIRFDVKEVEKMLANNVDIIIITSKQGSPTYSYIKKSKDLVVSVFEKQVISNDAISGVIIWKTGKMFFDYLEDMIKNKIKVNNEFYISPSINKAISDGKIVKNIECQVFYHLGTAEDINQFKDKLYDIHV